MSVEEYIKNLKDLLHNEVLNLNLSEYWEKRITDYAEQAKEKE